MQCHKEEDIRRRELSEAFRCFDSDSEYGLLHVVYSRHFILNRTYSAGV